jgi:uncharacterized membrane protein YhaH (DUF805 family)
VQIFDLLFSFKGHITRGQFWIGALVSCVPVFVGVFIAGHLVTIAQGSAPEITGAMALTMLHVLIPVIIGMLISIPIIAAICTKRIRAREKSLFWLAAAVGWMLLPFGLYFFLVPTLLSCAWAIVDLGCLGGRDTNSAKPLTPPQALGLSRLGSASSGGFGRRA